MDRRSLFFLANSKNTIHPIQNDPHTIIIPDCISDTDYWSLIV